MTARGLGCALLDGEGIAAILRADPVRWRLLGRVAALDLPDCWIAAGFVRNAVWDALHGRPPQPPTGDIDVVWFDPTHSDADRDRALEERLRQQERSFEWSVKNQARMHTRNGDDPYASATDAMRFWPETATAIAARRCGANSCQIAAPFGVQDLANLVLRPTHRFAVDKRAVYDSRISAKLWLERWPKLVLCER